MGPCIPEASNQQWKFDPLDGTIRSLSSSHLCIDSNIMAPPAGTNGQCTSLSRLGGDGTGLSTFFGPAVRVVDDCDTESSLIANGYNTDFSLSGGTGSSGRLLAGGMCVAARHGTP